MNPNAAVVARSIVWDWRRRYSLSLLLHEGKIKTQEARDKTSQSMKGNKNTQKIRDKQSKSMTGKICTQEARDKMPINDRKD